MTGKEPVVSHGRGGQGNIGADPTLYTDGEIVREGEYGDQGDGAYSAGRGGAGNITSPHVRPTTKVPHDADMIPELAVRGSPEGDYHTGRGGQGNVHLTPEHQKDKEKKMDGKGKGKERQAEKHVPSDHDHAHTHAHAQEGLADKLKHKLFGR